MAFLIGPRIGTCVLCSQRKKSFLVVSKKKYAQVAEMRGDIEELERRRTAEHREVAHDTLKMKPGMILLLMILIMISKFKMKI